MKYGSNERSGSILSSTGDNSNQTNPALNPSVKCDVIDYIPDDIDRFDGICLCKLEFQGHYEYSTKQVAIEDGHDNKRARSNLSSSSENLSDKYDHHIKKYVEFMTAVDQDWVEFEKAYNRSPTIDDINTLIRLSSDVLPEETTMTIDKIRNLFDDDYVLSNVIIGRMLSQEVTKIVSRIGHPIHNFFLLDCYSCKGLEQSTGI
ncbi:hypothetical protein GJ496_000086 [Pomphorhynchus laevis]|nr:hypothetical protein GJ496_000086 [Pomphorhynchus laevis]